MKLTQTDLNTQQNNKLLLYVFLGRIPFLSFQEKLFFTNNIDSAHTLALLSIEEIENKINRKFNKKICWDGEKNLLQSKRILEVCCKKDIQILLYEEDDYPALLKEIADPPLILFCRGDVSLLNKDSVSIVGTRRITQDGKESTINFAQDACLSGCNVVSGLANGVDSYAHSGSINAWFDCKEQGIDLSRVGRTIAVLPGSIDEIIPSTNKRLASQIIQTGGLLVSEYEPYTPMMKYHFVARNRIIAALSKATIVIQAPSGSGALITADFALDYDRDLFIHQAAFSSCAKQIAGIVKSQLEVQHAVGKVSRHKLENSVEKFIEAGAPVIKDYKDFCKAMAEKPETRQRCLQNELFE